jgi:hypothetical protein
MSTRGVTGSGWSRRGALAAISLLIGLAVVVVPSAALPPAGAVIAPGTGVVDATYVSDAEPIAVSCPSTTVCVAAAPSVILTSTDGGVTWTQHPVPSLLGYGGVSCGSVSDCVVAGGNMVVTTTNGGVTWTTQTFGPFGPSSDGVSCTSNAHCVASFDSLSYGLTVIVSLDGGLSWTTGDLDVALDALSSVACASSTVCFGAGYVGPPGSAVGTVIVSRDGGLTWTTSSAPSVATYFSDVACASPTTCVAVGANTTDDPSYFSSGVIITTTDSGLTWSQRSSPVDNDESVSCTAVGYCAVVGDGTVPSSSGSAIAVSLDGGLTWSQSYASEEGPTLLGIACVSNSTCLTVGQGEGQGVVIGTTDSGATWNSLATFGGTEVLAISCADALNCVAVQPNNILITSDGGGSWIPSEFPAGLSSLSALSCPTPQRCLATGEEPNNIGETAVMDIDGNSVTWILQPTPSPVNYPRAISCANETVCMALGSANIGNGPASAALVTNDGGTIWAVEPFPTTMEEAEGLSCPTASECVVVGQQPTAAPNAIALTTLDLGAHWSTGSLPDAIPQLDSVDCPTSQTCVAAGDRQLLTSTDGGASWRTDAVPPGTDGLNGVSCSSSTACFASSDGGNAIQSTPNGVDWTVAASNQGDDVSPISGAWGVSCPTATSCFVVGASSDYPDDGGVIESFGAPAPIATTVELTSSTPSAVVGQLLTYRATVSPTVGDSPVSGTVSFSDDGATIVGCTAQPLYPGTDQASCTTDESTATGHTVSAVYEGNAADDSSTATVTQPVQAALTSIDVTSTGDPLTTSQPVSFLAMVSISAPGSGPLLGGVYFSDNGTGIPGCASQPVNPQTGGASCTVSNEVAGNHQISAVYSGDPNIAGSVGWTAETVFALPAPLSVPAACPSGVTHQATGTPWAVAAMSAVIDGRTCAGYWIVTRNGGVTAVGAAPWLGDLSAHALNAPIVGISATADRGGYYLLGADGGIFTFGDATYHGSTGSQTLNAPVVAMAVSPDGGGYWLAAADGGIFTFGDAVFHGSAGAEHLNESIVGLSVDNQTGGYWMVAADGGIFAFDAPYEGSAASMGLNAPVVGMTTQPDGQGYRLVSRDGGVFDFGDATFFGSLPGQGETDPNVTTMASSVDGSGYYLINAEGTVWAFGDAPELGDS